MVPTTPSFSLRYTWSTERVGQGTPSPIINGWNLIWEWRLTFCQALPWLRQNLDSIFYLEIMVWLRDFSFPKATELLHTDFGACAVFWSALRQSIFFRPGYVRDRY
jgi:hypothetical protein